MLNEKDLKKHAFLILAHKDDVTFRTLIKMLDYEYNDIFVHMDKKNKNYNSFEVKNLCTKSKVYHTDRISVSWGGYSIVCAVLKLLKQSVSIGSYNYYHLLSGEDLPIKTQLEIHDFFDKQTREFVLFDDKTFKYIDRVKYYYPLQDLRGRKCLRVHNRALREISIAIQKSIGINRSKEVVYQKGCSWFSVTNEFANYIVSKEEWIKEKFEYTLMPDEIFIQTLLLTFGNKANECSFEDDYLSIKRLIDWKRGTPYVYKMSDIDEISKTEAFFARKFSANVDCNVIEYVYKTYG